LEKRGSAVDRASRVDYLFTSRGAEGAPPVRKGEQRVLRKTSAAAGVIAFATAGSALFGGAALADVTNLGGAGGAGGAATNNCLNVAIPVQLLNIAGTTSSDVAQCVATGGAGGAGGGATIDS
jgi:hypothetical protein